MGFATYSGPLRSGTVRYGASENTGVVKLARTATIAFSAMTTSPTAQLLFNLPAGTKIIRFSLEVITAITGGSVTNVGVTIGDSGTANKYLTSINTGTSVVKVPCATIDAAMAVAQTNNLGTVDVPVYGTFTAAGGNPTAGSIVVTVEYVQRLDDGSQVPAPNTY
jgi:hypothetical protein